MVSNSELLPAVAVSLCPLAGVDATTSVERSKELDLVVRGLFAATIHGVVLRRGTRGGPPHVLEMDFPTRLTSAIR